MLASPFSRRITVEEDAVERLVLWSVIGLVGLNVLIVIALEATVRAISRRKPLEPRGRSGQP